MTLERNRSSLQFPIDAGGISCLPPKQDSVWCILCVRKGPQQKWRISGNLKLATQLGDWAVTTGEGLIQALHSSFLDFSVGDSHKNIFSHIVK